MHEEPKRKAFLHSKPTQLLPPAPTTVPHLCWAEASRVATCHAGVMVALEVSGLHSSAFKTWRLPLDLLPLALGILILAVKVAGLSQLFASNGQIMHGSDRISNSNIVQLRFWGLTIRNTVFGRKSKNCHPTLCSGRIAWCCGFCCPNERVQTEHLHDDKSSGYERFNRSRQRRHRYRYPPSTLQFCRCWWCWRPCRT